MEVMSNAYKDKYYGGMLLVIIQQVIYEAPFGLNYPGGNPEGIASITNNALPGNDRVAEITQKDIDRFKQPMTQNMDYDTYKSINLDSTVTPSEFLQLKAMV